MSMSIIPQDETRTSSEREPMIPLTDVADALGIHVGLIWSALGAKELAFNGEYRTHNGRRIDQHTWQPTRAGRERGVIRNGARDIVVTKKDGTPYQLEVPCAGMVTRLGIHTVVGVMHESRCERCRASNGFSATHACDIARAQITALTDQLDGRA